MSINFISTILHCVQHLDHLVNLLHNTPPSSLQPGLLCVYDCQVPLTLLPWWLDVYLWSLFFWPWPWLEPRLLCARRAVLRRGARCGWHKHQLLNVLLCSLLVAHACIASSTVHAKRV